MTFVELIELARNTPIVVEFNANAENLECYPEKSMRATITSGRFAPDQQGNREDDLVVLEVDYTAFDEYNKQFESNNYYDQQGRPVFTARQAKMYHIKDTLYVMAHNDISEYLKIVDGDDLVSEWLECKEPKQTYVQWLEAQVYSARASW